MNKHYTLGGKEFPTKKSVKDYCREILRKSAPHFPLPADHQFLLDLLALHPRAKDKIGCGVRSFMVQVDPVWKTTRHFQLLRTDGSTTDWSFSTCLDGENHRANAIAALRHATSAQIIEFKRDQFDASEFIKCPFTGDLVTFNTCHVDHAAPDTFSALVTKWLTLSGITPDQVKLKPNCDNQWACEMTDPEQIKSWLEFHYAGASLRIVSPRANMELQKQQLQIA